METVTLADTKTKTVKTETTLSVPVLNLTTRPTIERVGEGAKEDVYLNGVLLKGARLTSWDQVYVGEHAWYGSRFEINATVATPYGEFKLKNINLKLTDGKFPTFNVPEPVTKTTEG